MDFIRKYDLEERLASWRKENGQCPFEAKGTTGGSINQALAEGKTQTAGITAPVQIKYRVAVGAVLGNNTKIILLDPPDPDDSVGSRPASTANGTGNARVAPTPDLVAKAAVAMRTRKKKETKPILETIFKSDAGEITLNCEFKEEKRHNWLDVK